MINNKGHILTFDSSILTAGQKIDLMKLCEFDLNIKFSLLYRASVDGFAASSFHAKCDNKGKTLTIIKAKGNSNVFGGFTELGWEGSDTYKNDQHAFIFSLTNRFNQPIKIKPSHIKSIYCCPNYGPAFGQCDFYISDNSNANQTSLCNLGHTFKHPTYLSTRIKRSQMFSRWFIQIFKRRNRSF